jgi:hypothetical protein
MSFDPFGVGGQAASHDVGLMSKPFGRADRRIEEDVVDGAVGVSGSC